VQLTLKHAVEVATAPQGSARIQIAGELLKQSQMRSIEARSALLPDFESSLRYVSQTISLAGSASARSLRSPSPASNSPFLSPIRCGGCSSDGATERL